MAVRTMEELKELDRAGYMVHKRLIDLGYAPTCTNCELFDKKTEICAKFQARPPAQVIAESCGKDWEMKIPF